MKKTKKENPITFFRKANEARQAVVKKSLKKAQDGIEVKDRWGRSKGDKWYGFNPESKKYESVYKPSVEKKAGKNLRYNEKERIDSSPNSMYLADKKGNVGTYTYYPDNTVSSVYIDTTGYSKGKQSFPKTYDIPGRQKETINISRSAAKNEIKKMKKSALDNRKKGGTIKRKK